jgi:hypothetical protein
VFRLASNTPCSSFHESRNLFFRLRIFKNSIADKTKNNVKGTPNRGAVDKPPTSDTKNGKNVPKNARPSTKVYKFILFSQLANSG